MKLSIPSPEQALVRFLFQPVADFAMNRFQLSCYRLSAILAGMLLSTICGRDVLYIVTAKNPMAEAVFYGVVDGIFSVIVWFVWHHDTVNMDKRFWRSFMPQLGIINGPGSCLNRLAWVVFLPKDIYFVFSDYTPGCAMSTVADLIAISMLFFPICLPKPPKPQRQEMRVPNAQLA